MNRSEFLRLTVASCGATMVTAACGKGQDPAATARSEYETYDEPQDRDETEDDPNEQV